MGIIVLALFRFKLATWLLEKQLFAKNAKRILLIGEN
jgi:hypothetical protein